MNISHEDLADLKQRYAKQYGVMLTDEEVQELARRLLLLFGVIGKKMPEDTN